MKRETLSSDGWFLFTTAEKEPLPRLAEEDVEWIKLMMEALETASA